MRLQMANAYESNITEIFFTGKQKAFFAYNVYYSPLFTDTYMH